jgi:hypothetical protein
VATIHCTNAECPEVNRPKDIADVYAAELTAGVIECGTCHAIIEADTLDPGGRVEP